MAAPSCLTRYVPDSENFPACGRNATFIEWAGHNKQVLELGCSTGFLSKHLTANGCRVTGVDYDSRATAIAAQHCADVIVADLNSDWGKRVRGQFDVITCGDVLEHLVDPAAVLVECRRFLRQNGLLIISLPNVAHISNRLRLLLGRWDYTDTGLLDRTHLRFFTMQTARQLIHGAGYVIERFHPAVAGVWGAGHFPVLFNNAGRMFPELLAYQMLFLCSRTIPH